MASAEAVCVSATASSYPSILLFWTAASRRTSSELFGASSMIPGPSSTALENSVAPIGRDRFTAPARLVEELQARFPVTSLHAPAYLHGKAGSGSGGAGPCRRTSIIQDYPCCECPLEPTPFVGRVSGDGPHRLGGAITHGSVPFVHL